MGGACSGHGRVEKYNILVVKPERNRPLGRSRRGWGAIIRMVLREM